MAKRMTDVELDAFREALAVLTARGNEAAVREHVNTFFPRLPEAMQNEILAGMYLDSLREEIAEGVPEDDAEGDE